jgi:hypothetical protein
MSRLPWALFTAGLLALLAMSESSCAISAYLLAKFSPPEKVEPEYAVAKGKTVLVFVDDMLNPLSYPPLKAELSGMIGEELLKNEVAAKVIAYDRLADLASSTPTFNSLAIGEVGQKLGADLVLYVQIDEFDLRDPAAPQLWKGHLQVTVWLVDVTKGRLWPTNRSAGFPVPPADTPTSTESSESHGEQLATTLAAMTADSVAKLFYKHEKPHETAWPQ